MRYRIRLTAASLLFGIIAPALLPGQTTSAIGPNTQAQNMQALLDQSYRLMYNLQFEQAFRTAEDAKKLDKNDPMPWVAQACAALFREFDRLHILRSETFASDESFFARSSYSWVPASKQQFDSALSGAEKLAQQMLAHDKDDPRGLFALTIVNGLRADDLALISKKNMSALSYTKTASGYAERLLARTPDAYDAYVATGMGKYLIGSKPAPVRWLLRLDGMKGDQEEGVRELTLVAQHGHYLAPFARILLAFDDLRHKRYAAARVKLEWLHDQFPGNPLFVQEMAKLNHPSPGHGQ